MTTASPVTPPRTRNRAQTEARLRQAVEDLLIEGGFAALTPSAVGRKAGVDKMLIYRYFGDLPGLIRKIAFAPDFFPNLESLCDGDPDAVRALAPGPRAALILGRMTRARMDRPVLLELMVWELVERNELTAIMEEARETLGLRIMAELFPEAIDPPRAQAVAAILSAGLTYLAIRRRKIRWFNGVDLAADAGWRDLAAAVEVMAGAALS
jgi:AcrR family transcriptional regulator